MFQAILRTQWKSSRLIVLLATITAFALPVAALGTARGGETPIAFVSRMQNFAGGYALLAAVLGLLVAMSAWQPDHAGRHVYALTLPISRVRYAGYRLGAGFLFLLIPVLALLVGALFVALSSAIPEGLRAYPVVLTLRFALATGVAFTIFFAIAASTPQTAGVVIGIIAAVLFTQYLLSITSSDIDIIEPIMRFIFVEPGLLSVFTGRWMLVDV